MAGSDAVLVRCTREPASPKPIRRHLMTDTILITGAGFMALNKCQAVTLTDEAL
jgi:hypothetical protein